MASKSVCSICGGARDRGAYTKICSKCFLSKCPRCGGVNDRGPHTVLCGSCKSLPNLKGSGKCQKCSRPNDRGGRTKICSECMSNETARVKKVRLRLMNSESRPGFKWCPTCESYKEYDNFYTTSRTTGDSCKECAVTSGNNARLKSNYNLTEADYQKILDYQGGVCAICGNKPSKKRFHVDHDHITGLIRGILCLWCNHKVLGGARDNVEVLESAAKYLKSPPAVSAIGSVYGKIGSINKKKSNKGK